MARTELLQALAGDATRGPARQTRPDTLVIAPALLVQAVCATTMEEVADRDKERDDRRSRDDDRDRRREREREKRDRRDERSDSEDDAGPPEGVKELGEDDYFLKATELKLWLWEEKGKKLDNLKTEDARRYFRKFCRAWNRGRLSNNYYNGISPASLPSSISTSHSWSFAKASQADLDAAASVRKSIDTGSKTRSYDAGSSSVVGPSLPSQRGPALGPSMPPSSAVERLQLERDARQSASESERSASHAKRKRESRDARDEERDNRATGRDRLMEKRREGNASRRDFEASREAGMQEFDDDALMGGSTGGGGPPGSFADAVRERERAQQRRDERRKGKDEERKAEICDKLSAFRAKEDQTMAMFREMAAKRFG
ncbi:LOW QUALITY PROTEIN: hypothetical protein RTBOTA2_006135 [Rhodotorula toruloides]|nr:LOW QUALITY PROTEIN: hypothetical protein RTBOTA2_006135 [Rhodotorula toruloides]